MKLQFNSLKKLTKYNPYGVVSLVSAIFGFLDKYHVGKSRNYSNLESLEKLHRRFGEIKVSERENGRPSGKARIAGSAVSAWAGWEWADSAESCSQSEDSSSLIGQYNVKRTFFMKIYL